MSSETTESNSSATKAHRKRRSRNRSEGPERIACEWWKDGRAAYTRDYFRIEPGDGYRLWLFRNGLYDRETNTPKWYVHGMFA